MSVTSQCTENNGYPYIVLNEPNDSIDQKIYVQGEIIYSVKCPDMSLSIYGGTCNTGKRIALRRSTSFSIPANQSQRWVIQGDGTIQTSQGCNPLKVIGVDSSDTVIMMDKSGVWNEQWTFEVSMQASTWRSVWYCQLLNQELYLFPRFNSLSHSKSSFTILLFLANKVFDKVPEFSSHDEPNYHDISALLTSS